MIDPVTGYFDHPLQTPPAPMRSYRCGACDGTGVPVDKLNLDRCDCLCHEGAVAVRQHERAGDLVPDLADKMIESMQKGDGFCAVCKDIHACLICGGRGEI